MRTTIDIPDPLYQEIKLRAAVEGTTIREIVLESVAVRLHNRKSKPTAENQPRFPTLESKHPGSLKLGKEGVYEYIPFP